MNIDGVPTRSLRADPDRGAIEVLDQTRLPHTVAWVRVASLADAAHAIRAMQVRGAPLIGVTAAYGLALAMGHDSSDTALDEAVAILAATRPTAVNLAWALVHMADRVRPLPPADRRTAAWAAAAALAEADVAQNQAIGRHGLGLLRSLPTRHPGGPLNIMTHCNAGWLATVDGGTALAPVYAAYDAGLPIHVWVSETRPRNQGLLTAWELSQHGVPHTVIADNAAGHLLAAGRVDAVLVGADRIARNGDVANKVGTYLKALAARDNGVPFYVAAPRSTIDFACPDGAAIPIEEREGDEVRLVCGLDAHGTPATMRVLSAGAGVSNPAFDVTPARLISGIITERGVHPATTAGLAALDPDPA
jgi:methylthioribose-1-phosphate isomerase